MRTIFILMDSLNRHHLRTYGGDMMQTPSIDRLATQGVVFDNHWCGSLPCMPARRELMTGRLNFLETPWGPIEPWDECLPTELRTQQGVYSHLITDHYHYFHSGGEAYHTLFDTWEFERGQEGDVWHALVDAPQAPAGARGRSRARRAYWVNREFRNPQEDLDYPTPRCFARAMEFLDNNHTADDWHLHLEVFDPHEPFDCPDRYREMYDDTWDRYFYNSPDYAELDPEQDDPETVAHIRKSYAGALTMADVWLGKFLAKMDEYDMWEDTVVVLTTDHGHLLGEHGYWAKNYMMVYNELARIPLVVCAPQASNAGARVQSMTTTIDLMPTFLDLHDATPPRHVRGVSLRHLLDDCEPHHDAVLFGYFGKDVNLTDGKHTYCRQPVPGATVHHHTAMPRSYSDFIDRQTLAQAETGVFLPTTHGVPHFRIARASSRHKNAPDYNPIHSLQVDADQNTPIHNATLEDQLARKMRELLTRHDAPECQFARLGL
ncbi:MAG: sulfatase [Lentisphaeria bacterium]|nr:sulfatase [Lentisphaeria bacterium]